MSADHLFYVSRANIFSIYPKILKEILLSEELNRVRESLTGSLCFLPSDFDWQMRMYFRLLEQQKLINLAVERGEVFHDLSYKKNKVFWESTESCSASRTSTSTSPEQYDGYISKKRKICTSDDIISYCNADEVSLWDSEDFAKAGKLLKKPPMPVSFVDEYEMRKVYSLIYDVYRYKLVLNQTLNDIGFFAMHPKLLQDNPRVWLLLFELYCRKFMKRDPEATKIKDTLFAKADLLDIEDTLWKYKTKLAASITRLRIQSNALVLSQLLPKHLQDNKVALAVSSPILTGWVNNFQARKTKKAATAILSELLMTPVEDNGEKLEEGQYKWDKICPQFLTMYPSNRSDFVKSEMIRKSEFIIQDRAFSIGPAIFAKMLDMLDLRGDVVQTHIFSPRSTAYLASLLMNNDRVSRFIVFGAGNKLEEYKRYMTTLGVSNITLVGENFTEMTTNSNYLQKSVGVFATPPSSYSGISDPIDLICSRGGDLSMLEVLSESEMTDEGQKRVAQVLMEQRETLKKSMSRQYVQFIIYETHSIVHSENEEMVEKTIEFMNRKALDKHVRLTKEREKESLAETIDNSQIVNDPSKVQPLEEAIPKTTDSVKASPMSSKRVTIEKGSTIDNESGSESDGDASKAKLSKKSSKMTITEEDYSRIQTPNTDIFATTPLPDLCRNRDQCLNLAAQGCYLALLQRKELVRLDSKYLIKMAEVRGIFGDADKKKCKSSTQKRLEKKAEELQIAAEEQNKKLKRSKSRNIQELIDRINTPTHASSKRGHFHRISTANLKFMLVESGFESFCPRLLSRHSEYVDDSIVSYMQVLQEQERRQQRAKCWWRETLRHMIKLKALSFGTAVSCMQDAWTFPLMLTRSEQSFNTAAVSTVKENRKKGFNKLPYPLPVSNVVFGVFETEKSLMKDMKTSGRAKLSRSVNEEGKDKNKRHVRSTVSY